MNYYNIETAISYLKHEIDY